MRDMTMRHGGVHARWRGAQGNRLPLLFIFIYLVVRREKGQKEEWKGYLRGHFFDQRLS